MYKVDPNWLQYMISPIFFVSFAVTLICCYVASPLLASILVPKINMQKLEVKTTYFHSFLGSAVHSIAAIVFASYILATGVLSSDKIFATSPASFAALHLTVGYAVGDMVICLRDPYLRRSHSTMLHHLAMIAGIGMCLYYQLFTFFVVYRFLSELSTPFVNLRSVIYEVGDKKGRWYFISSIGMMVTFFLCRILVIPWHTYHLFMAVLSANAATVPLVLKVYMIVNFTAFDTLNIFWFNKIVKGGYKFFWSRKRHK